MLRRAVADASKAEHCASKEVDLADQDIVADAVHKAHPSAAMMDSTTSGVSAIGTENVTVTEFVRVVHWSPLTPLYDSGQAA